MVDAQIKRAYEVEGMTPEEISEDQNLDVVAVKAKLMQVSGQYRMNAGTENPEKQKLNFTDQQQEDFMQVIHECATSAEHSDGAPDYRTRLAAAIYGRDDGKGRKDRIKDVRDLGGNIFMINQLIAGARAGAAQIKDAMRGEQKAIVDA